MNRLAYPCLFALALLAAGTAAGQSSPRSADLGRLSHSLESVVSKVAPAVGQGQLRFVTVTLE